MMKTLASLALLSALVLAGCSSAMSPAGNVDDATRVKAAVKSPKRGVAYDLATAADLAALSPGVSWWYNWAAEPNKGVPSSYVTQYGMDY